MHTANEIIDTAASNSEPNFPMGLFASQEFVDNELHADAILGEIADWGFNLPHEEFIPLLYVRSFVLHVKREGLYQMPIDDVLFTMTHTHSLVRV